MKNRNISWYALLLILAAVTAFLVSSHYVKAYSDPVGWLLRAESMARGEPVTGRAPLYPAFLILALKVLGPMNVFLSNMPFLILLLALVYLMTRESLFSYLEDRQEPDSLKSAAALLSVAILVVANKRLFLELLNPFREALAFTLAAASVLALLSYLKSRKSAMLVASGVILGLSIGVRETSILVLPSYCLLYLYHAFGRKDLPWFRAAAFFFLGLAFGLLPLMVQNILHSGHFWLPSYAAARWQGGSALRIPSDFPVPGMSFTYFATTGSKTVSFFMEKYGLAGGALLAFSLVQCVRKRYIRMLLLIFPTALTTLLFYSLYWYVKARYLFMVDIFLVPLMAPGLMFFAGLFCRTGKPGYEWRARIFERGAAALAVAVTAGLLVFQIYNREERFKVWDVQELRQALEHRLERPFTFISANRHYRQLLSWFFQVPYAGRDLGISEQRIRAEGSENAIRRTGRELFEFVEERNIYHYGDNPQFILKNWFDFHKVFSFSDLSKPPDRYGKPLRDGLYRVRPWSKREVARTLELGGIGRKKLLMADFYRIWDYRGRATCRLFAGEDLIEDRVPDGFHFVEVDSNRLHSGEVTVRAISDGPLPQNPYLKIVDIDEEFDVFLGAGPDYWYYPFLSEDLLSFAPLKTDATILFDRGEIEVPLFAMEGKDVYAVFMLEFYQEDPYFRKDHFLYIDDGKGEQRSALPQWRKKGYVARYLGPGTGHLEMVPLRLRTTLPSRPQQERMRVANEAGDFGFVKLYGIKFMHTMSVLDGKVTIDVGTVEDAPWVLEGFHGRESHQNSVPVRWTGPSARIRMPKIDDNKELRVNMRTVEVRPEGLRKKPSFFVDGREVPAQAVNRKVLEGGIVEYSFTIPPAFNPSEGGELLIMTETWIPSSVIGNSDLRELGVLVDRIEMVAESLKD